MDERAEAQDQHRAQGCSDTSSPRAPLCVNPLHAQNNRLQEEYPFFMIMRSSQRMF